MESNLSYLKDELKRIYKRISSGEKWLKENPAISYFKREINGRKYIYGSQKIKGKVHSNLISTDVEILPELREKSAKRRELKKFVSDLKRQQKALLRQIKIVEKVLNEKATCGIY